MNNDNETKKHFVVTALKQGVGVIDTGTELTLVDVNGQRLGQILHGQEAIDWSDAYDILGGLRNDSQQLAPADAVTTQADVIQYDELIIYTDGGSRGNPGPSASGFVIMDNEEKIIEEGGEYLGITTNNQAEYQAVKIALEAAYKYKPVQIRFRIDSLLVVNQMLGKFKIKNKDLWPINSAIHKLIDSHEAKVDFMHVRREFNKLADEKVNKILDARDS